MHASLQKKTERTLKLHTASYSGFQNFLPADSVDCLAEMHTTYINCYIIDLKINRAVNLFVCVSIVLTIQYKKFVIILAGVSELIIQMFLTRHFSQKNTAQHLKLIFFFFFICLKSFQWVLKSFFHQSLGVMSKSSLKP